METKNVYRVQIKKYDNPFNESEKGVFGVLVSNGDECLAWNSYLENPTEIPEDVPTLSRYGAKETFTEFPTEQTVFVLAADYALTLEHILAEIRSGDSSAVNKYLKHLKALPGEFKPIDSFLRPWDRLAAQREATWLEAFNHGMTVATKEVTLTLPEEGGFTTLSSVTDLS